MNEAIENVQREQDMCNPYIRSLHGRIPLSVPSSWKVLTVADFQESSIQKNAADCFTSAMKKPVAASPIEEQISPETIISILVEDMTRKSPKTIILERLLERLTAVGVRDKNISIVISLGSHQPLSVSELESAFGKEMVAAYSFFNHDCRAEDLIPIGRLASGATVKINRLVYEADYRIGIGSIFPHPLNGFGGGGKILFPGVADIDSITEHHLKHSFRENACLGNFKGNTFYNEVLAMAKAGHLDFIINSVLDHNDQLHDIVCGDFVQAHLAGAQLCKKIISKSFTAKSDVTIISAFPYTEGPQIMKPLAPADMITKKTGIIILYADCSGTLPEIYFKACEKFRSDHAGRLREKVLEYFAANRPILPGAPPELNMSMAQVMLALNDYEVILVTKDISEKQAQRLGFGHASNLDAAVAACKNRYAEPTVNVVPSGGVILPVVPEP